MSSSSSSSLSNESLISDAKTASSYSSVGVTVTDVSMVEDPEEATPKKSSTLCVVIVTILKIILIPIFFLLFLVVVLVLVVLWILPQFGRCYESYSVARDRRRYAPPPSELHPWGPKGERIHVVHRRPEGCEKNPPIVYVSGLGASMSIVSGLLDELQRELSAEGPFEMVSWDSPGYGFSEPPLNEEWAYESNVTEMEMARNVMEKLGIRRPFLLFGGSAGATMALLYTYRYPKECVGTILYDPTPFTVYDDPKSPFFKEFQSAERLWSMMAKMASVGWMRPFLALFPLIPHEFGDIFRKLPKAHLSIFMTYLVMRKTGNHFRYWKLEMDDLKQCVKDMEEDAKKAEEIGPIILVSALNWKNPHMHQQATVAQLREWWLDNQMKMVVNERFRLPSLKVVGRKDYDHADCMLNMKIASDMVREGLKRGLSTQRV